ncbi:AMP-binding protein [Desulfosporosinus metallidurans]|uniref:Acetyl-coenzyme A synthetase n=1 Tax=Desulfosporosinus metallidurans TaxID=1888891 RepID=A0A1Q8QMB8_9FIRM|nr:AMP-binding protein [Desulfosporosinus metallidurans]OLN28486.1 Acetyl-coenzyme A synthetase [Desulfosporosinus metallidurans]
MSNVKFRNEILLLLEKYGAQNLSVAELLCDRHAKIPEKVALFYESENGDSVKYTFAELKELSSKFARVLAEVGIQKGDRVGVMLPKCPEMVITALAVWRLGAVYLPLFTAFGPSAIAHRLTDSEAKVVVTDTNNRPKLEDLMTKLPVSIVTVSDQFEEKVAKDEYSFWNEMKKSEPIRNVTLVNGDDLLILLYTSGTTGNPKGVKIPVKSLASFEAYMRFALDLRNEDMYWNLADPGWAYGLYYNLIGPLLIGKATLFYGGPFNPNEVYRILEKYSVTNFAAAPTAYKTLINAGKSAALKYKSFLRAASSAGEPLNPNIISWAQEVWGIPIHDHFGQTELGMAVNNHHLPELQEKLKPGSMGKSMPGFKMTVLDAEGKELGPNQEGQMAVDILNSPLYWFQNYWNDTENTKMAFTSDGRYYFAGDSASMDEDGYLFFSGRSDDIILSAGYRIGPFEIESALMQHDAVSEAAVVGVPDQLRGEIVKAFIILRDGYSSSNEIAKELSTFVKERLSAHEYPRQVSFLDELPKTPSGKIQRFLLKNAEYKVISC